MDELFRSEIEQPGISTIYDVLDNKDFKGAVENDSDSHVFVMYTGGISEIQKPDGFVMVHRDELVYKEDELLEYTDDIRPDLVALVYVNFFNLLVDGEKLFDSDDFNNNPSRMTKSIEGYSRKLTSNDNKDRYVIIAEPKDGFIIVIEIPKANADNTSEGKLRQFKLNTKSEVSLSDQLRALMSDNSQ